MNVEIGTVAAQFLEKEHINGIFVAVYVLNQVASETLKTKLSIYTVSKL